MNCPVNTVDVNTENLYHNCAFPLSRLHGDNAKNACCTISSIFLSCYTLTWILNPQSPIWLFAVLLHLWIMPYCFLSHILNTGNIVSTVSKRILRIRCDLVPPAICWLENNIVISVWLQFPYRLNIYKTLWEALILCRTRKVGLTWIVLW